MLGQSSDLPAWLNAVLGPLGLLVFLILAVVYGGMRRWWVWGWQYDDKVTELEELKQENHDLRRLGFSATSAAESSVNVAERIAQTKIHEFAEEVDAARRRGEIR